MNPPPGSPRLRIGILSPSFPPNEAPCGVGDYTRCLIAALAGRGVEVVVLAGPGYRGGEERPDARVIRLDGSWTPRAMAAVARTAREEGVHALLVQYAPDLYPPSPVWANALPLFMKALSPGIPTVLSLHTVGVSRPLSMLGAGLMLVSADAVLATNEEVVHLVGKYLRPVLRKTAEIPIGANVEPPAPDEAARQRARLREETGLGPEGAILAHFGFYYPGKGVEQILEAAARWKAQGRAFRALMLGGGRAEGEPYRAELIALSSRLGLEREVVWTGYLPDERASEILLGADLFLAPYEGGISSRRGSLMAALAHGLPVVSTPSKIPTRYFRAGENFAQVSFGDAGALAAEVAALMDDPERRARLAAAGAELYRRCFAWPEIARRTERMLRAVVRGEPLSEAPA